MEFNVGRDNHVITFVSTRRFGLVGIHQRLLEGNTRVGKTGRPRAGPYRTSMRISFRGLCTVSSSKKIKRQLCGTHIFLWNNQFTSNKTSWEPLFCNTRTQKTGSREYTVLTALSGVLNACVLLLATRLHSHHTMVSVGHAVCTTHRREHGGTLGGTLALGSPVGGLYTVCPISTVSLLTRL
jgi:hypothetical protein